jgi:hypothetical protein
MSDTNPQKDSTVQKYLAKKINIFLNVPGIYSGTLASILDILDAFSFKRLYPILSLNLDFFPYVVQIGKFVT